MTHQGIQQFVLPDVGEGLTEAEILTWHVQPGDQVDVNQVICEIETAKAVVELPSPFAGRVEALLVEAGETVPVGTPIIAVDTGGAAGEPRPEPAPAAAPAEPPAEEKREPVLVGYGVKSGATKRRARRRTPSAVPAQTVGQRTVVLAKPPVRKLAKDLGVDLRTVVPSGPNGVITRDDVRRHAEQNQPQPSAPRVPEPAAPAPAASPAPERDVREERIPVKGVLKHMAAAMVDSAFTAPHVTEFLQVDVTKTVKVVQKLRQRPEFADVKVSPLLLVARALLIAVRRHPRINASWDEANQEVVVKHYVNLGIAAATDRGLVVPNIKDADRLPLPDLARALTDLTEKARAGQTAPADLTGGTITITNIGVFGIDGGTPILNRGEAAILALGQIRDMPWVHKGKIKIRKVTTLSLSFDHRLVDGELGSKVLRDVATILEDPEEMVLAWG
ncbi:branched-chain alpha-keto acid dehydrogenase subunit E2 [Thermobifida fusca TM51]|uniref:Dihydrolipoamide acetyltransferase component of pyruvate dehydrogenase complex n=1 Tax=Thermobifida fusca TM51 TaxID=1169414 RepID=A0A9P2TCZ6_THEFU|nr:MULTISPECIES: dihydrolipoamide acetyltransferase family protein [Thermobifida]EOR72717.1 branched-chain alpha-keto acid dehydrogenase subunit E2 [Thermobifida fusca TM51]MBO2528688.1 2-oxo acid dehydrogenase subunit E2 [Thermobifida sp.]MDD6791286.1 dihydrolipoamide acetyltransferase family protein [Thermobifida fusca]PPS92026.1 branched-chain alpha-keto acid dehydrogenase subunit E2 [Thermobifida fusca]QOS59782.1 2-oxo acid dehydrogenase subunit E2 [Thermobifida fusca]